MRKTCGWTVERLLNNHEDVHNFYSTRSYLPSCGVNFPSSFPVYSTNISMGYPRPKCCSAPMLKDGLSPLSTKPITTTTYLINYI